MRAGGDLSLPGSSWPVPSLAPTPGARIEAEIAEGSLSFVDIGQTEQMSPESDPTRVYPGKVLRRAGVFGAWKLQSDDANERTDDRVAEVGVDSTGAPFLVGQRVLVKFLKARRQATVSGPARS